MCRCLSLWTYRVYKSARMRSASNWKCRRFRWAREKALDTTMAWSWRTAMNAVLQPTKWPYLWAVLFFLNCPKCNTHQGKRWSLRKFVSPFNEHAVLLQTLQQTFKFNNCEIVENTRSYGQSVILNNGLVLLNNVRKSLLFEIYCDRYSARANLLASTFITNYNI